VHGIGTFAYTCPAHLGQGHNVTIQALFDTLVLLKKKRNGAPFPPVLYLQLDNTTKQCKGKYLAAFTAMLVHFDVFKKVVIGFLPVGHTHEDIDQFFSRIATQMRLHDAFCRVQFAERIHASFTKYGLRPVVRHWTNVANISGWLESRLIAMKDITAFHQFRFQRSNEDGHVWMQGRRWPGGGHEDHWGGLHGNQTHQQVFKDNVVPSLLDEYDQVPPASRATEIPSAVTLGKVRAGLDTLFGYLKVPAHQQEDCNKVFTLYATPEEVDIPFEWAKEDIKLLLQPSVDPVDKPAPAHDDPIAADGMRVWTTKFYIMRPADPDNTDKTQRDSHPINIVRVKHILGPGDRSEDGDRLVLVQWWDLQAADQLTNNWIGGKWVPNERHKPPVSWGACERYACSMLQCEVAVAHASDYAMSLHKSSTQGQSLANYWLKRYQGGKDYELHEDELLDQAGYAQCAVPEVRPRAKKKNPTAEVAPPRSSSSSAGRKKKATPVPPVPSSSSSSASRPQKKQKGHPRQQKAKGTGRRRSEGPPNYDGRKVWLPAVFWSEDYAAEQEEGAGWVVTLGATVGKTRHLVEHVHWVGVDEPIEKGVIPTSELEGYLKTYSKKQPPR
jgi:hypothetical protein